MRRYIEEKLIDGYTLFIRKKADGLKGTLLKNKEDGVHYYELPNESISFIKSLDKVSKTIDDGAILQINMQGYCTMCIIGHEITEGPYCETRCLEVMEQNNNCDCIETLIELNKKLGTESDNNDKKHKILRKGVYRYE